MTPYLVSQPPERQKHESFTTAEVAFRKLHDDLVADRRSDHASVERTIQARGTEVMRLLLEGWCNDRVASERRDVTGADGIHRTHHRAAAREVESLFGTVNVARDRAGTRYADALVPGDGALNLPKDRFTFGVRQRVAEEALRGSFEAAATTLAATTGAQVAKRQAEELTVAASTDFDMFYKDSCRWDNLLAVPTTALLVLTADGKGIVMRSEGLRPATRKAAEKASPKLKHRKSKGEKGNRKRMATVAAVYFQEPTPRSADDILGELDQTVVKPRARPKRKRVFASVKKTSRAVIGEAFEEAAQRDPRHRHRWIALVDGNSPQIADIQAAAVTEGVEVTLVLDFIHVTEYLWAAAWEFHEEGDPAVEEWVNKYLHMILDGRASTAAAAIRRSATIQKLKKRTSIDKAATYFINKKELMRYDEYLRDGLPIATGVIEGACRYLVKDRMDITGARWGLDGAEAVLRLRSIWASGDLEEYWRFHQDLEFERNHVSQYAESEDDWLLNDDCLLKRAA